MLTICWANKAGGISIDLVTLNGSLYVHIFIIMLSFQVTQLLVNVTDVSKKANVSKFYSQQDVTIDQVWTLYLPSIDLRIILSLCCLYIKLEPVFRIRCRYDSFGHILNRAVPGPNVCKGM